MRQGDVNCRSNIYVLVAAAPQRVLLYKFVCFACAGARKTHKLVLQLIVAAGDSPVHGSGSLVSIVPLVIAFLFLQRYWQGGLTFGSVKT